MSSRVDAEALGELRRQGGLIKHLTSTDLQNAYEYRGILNVIQQTIGHLLSRGDDAETLNATSASYRGTNFNDVREASVSLS